MGENIDIEPILNIGEMERLEIASEHSESESTSSDSGSIDITQEIKFPMGYSNRLTFPKEQTDPKPSINTKIMQKLGHATVARSVYNLSASAIGAGILSLPFVMRIGGVILGSLLSVTGLFTSLWAFYLMIRAAKITKAKNYMSLCRRTNGKWLGYIMEVCRVVYLIGVITIYQIMCRDLAVGFLEEFGVSSSILENHWAMTLHPILVALVILLPLCLMKDLNSLSIFSLISLITMGYTVFLIIVEMPFYYAKNIDKVDSSVGIKYFVMNLGTADAVSFTVFAFAAQPCFFNIYSELRNPEGHRIRRVIKISMVLNFILYYLIAIMGYLSTFEETNTIVCMREPLPWFSNGIDYFMTIGKIGVYITLIISIPVTFVVLRRAILNLFWGTRMPVKNAHNIGITLTILTIVTTICIVFPKLRSVINIIGGFCAPILCFIVPTIAYVTVRKLPWYNYKILLSILLTIVISGVGFTSTIHTLYRIVHGTAT